MSDVRTRCGAWLRERERHVRTRHLATPDLFAWRYYEPEIDVLEAFAKEMPLEGMEHVRKEIRRRIDVLAGRLEDCHGEAR